MREIAVISGCIYFVPGLPNLVHETAIPVAVVAGASALLLVGIYDKLDTTTVRICRVPTEEAYDSLSERLRTQPDVMFWWPEK